MPCFPSSALFQKNNARNIIYMAVLIFLKCLDLRKMPILGQAPGNADGAAIVRPRPVSSPVRAFAVETLRRIYLRPACRFW